VQWPLTLLPAPCRALVDKDVVRTDRTTAFFQDLEGPNLRQLNDILVTYTFFNFDLGAGNTSAPPYLCLFYGLASDLTSCTPLFLGYVQGMNDLLSPTMMIMQDEVDSFWCFKGIMDNMVALLPAYRSPSNRHTLLRFPITDACLCTGPGGQLRTRTTGNASAVGAASRDPLRARPPALRPHGQTRQP